MGRKGSWAKATEEEEAGDTPVSQGNESDGMNLFSGDSDEMARFGIAKKRKTKKAFFFKKGIKDVRVLFVFETRTPLHHIVNKEKKMMMNLVMGMDCLKWILRG